MLTRVPEEFLNVFRVACEKEVTLTFESKKKAERARFKFHKIRVRMRKEEHPDLKSAEMVSFQVRDNLLIVVPDIDFMDELALALEPHKELLEQAKLKEQAEDAAWVASEAVRLSESMNKMHKRESTTQAPSVQELLSRK